MKLLNHRLASTRCWAGMCRPPRVQIPSKVRHLPQERGPSLHARAQFTPEFHEAKVDGWGSSVGWSVGGLVGLVGLIGWLVCLVGWLVGWLVGALLGCFFVFFFLFFFLCVCLFVLFGWLGLFCCGVFESLFVCLLGCVCLFCGAGVICIQRQSEPPAAQSLVQFHGAKDQPVSLCRELFQNFKRIAWTYFQTQEVGPSCCFWF